MLQCVWRLNYKDHHGRIFNDFQGLSVNFCPQMDAKGGTQLQYQGCTHHQPREIQRELDCIRTYQNSLPCEFCKTQGQGFRALKIHATYHAFWPQNLETLDDIALESALWRFSLKAQSSNLKVLDLAWNALHGEAAEAHASDMFSMSIAPSIVHMYWLCTAPQLKELYNSA